MGAVLSYALEHLIHVYNYLIGRVKKKPSSSLWCPATRDKRQWAHIEMQADPHKQKKRWLPERLWSLCGCTAVADPALREEVSWAMSRGCLCGCVQLKSPMHPSSLPSTPASKSLLHETLWHLKKEAFLPQTLSKRHCSCLLMVRLSIQTIGFHFLLKWCHSAVNKSKTYQARERKVSLKL